MVMSCCAVSAEENDEVAPEVRPMPSLLRLPKDIWSDLGEVVEVPRKMHRGERHRALLTLGALGALAVWDEDIRDYAQERHDTFYDDFKPLGEGQYSAVFFLTLYGAGRLIGHYGMAETGAAGTEALILTAVPTLLLQAITGRERPDDGGRYRWFGMSDGHGASGHAAVAFATVTVLDRRLFGVEDEMSGGEKILRYAGKFILYGAAFGTALERINDDKHFAADVAIGGSIGFLCANFVMNRRDAGLRVVLDGGGPTVAIVREF